MEPTAEKPVCEYPKIYRPLAGNSNYIWPSSSGYKNIGNEDPLLPLLLATRIGDIIYTTAATSRGDEPGIIFEGFTRARGQIFNYRKALRAADKRRNQTGRNLPDTIIISIIIMTIVCIRGTGGPDVHINTCIVRSLCPEWKCYGSDTV